MQPPPAQHCHKRYSIGWQARLDPETQAKLQKLAQALHRKRAQILRHAMQWALTRTNSWMMDRSIPATPRLVTMLVNSDLLQRVQDTAATHGASVAAWVRQAMRHITFEDFPASWRGGEKPSRSHESGHYQRRFMLRLDNKTSHKLETLARVFDRPAAEVIRQLIAQAIVDDFPASWRRAGS